MTKFKEYRIVHDFYHTDPLKSWINKSNFIDLFRGDWNCLMGVVDKISELDDRRYSVQINFDQTNIVDTDNDEELVQEYAFTRKEAAYQAIVEFIKWYNKQQA